MIPASANIMPPQLEMKIATLSDGIAVKNPEKIDFGSLMDRNLGDREIVFNASISGSGQKALDTQSLSVIAPSSNPVDFFDEEFIAVSVTQIIADNVAKDDQTAGLESAPNLSLVLNGTHKSSSEKSDLGSLENADPEEIDQFKSGHSVIFSLQKNDVEEQFFSTRTPLKNDVLSDSKAASPNILAAATGRLDGSEQAETTEVGSSKLSENNQEREFKQNVPNDPLANEPVPPKQIPTNTVSVAQAINSLTQSVSTDIGVVTTSQPKEITSIDAAKDQVFITQVRRDIDGISSRDFDVKFKVAPEYLGKLNVEILRDKSETHVRLETETESARSLILAAQSKLENEIRSAGAKLTRLDVAVDQGSDEGSDMQGYQNEKARNRSANCEAEGIELAPAKYPNANRTIIQNHAARYA